MESIINLLQKLIDPFHPTTIHQYMLLLFIITSATIFTSKKKINTYAKQYSIFQNYLKILKKIMSLIPLDSYFYWLLFFFSVLKYLSIFGTKNMIGEINIRKEKSFADNSFGHCTDVLITLTWNTVRIVPMVTNNTKIICAMRWFTFLSITGNTK